MPIEIIIVFALLGMAVILFVTELISFDLTALIILALLMGTGILTPAEGLSGFSNPATITVTFMFVISEGLRITGFLNSIGDFFANRIRKNHISGLFFMLLFIGFCSAFINNTAIVIIFIPVVIEVAARINISPSKLLIPLSFAGILGGISTLIGTSTNILTSSIVEEHGLRSLSMFEFSPMGLILMCAGLLYLIAVGLRSIPDRRKNEELTRGYRIQDYLADVVIEPGNSLVGEVFDEAQLTQRLDLNVLRIFKKDIHASIRRSKTILEDGDILRIRGSAKEIKKMLDRDDFSLKPSTEWRDIDLEKGRDTLAEAVVAPESSMVGKTLSTIQFTRKIKAVPLAIRHRGEMEREDLENIQLFGGDVILLNTSADQLALLSDDPAFVIVSELPVSEQRREKTAIVLLTLAGVVLTAAFNIFPVVVSALIGVIVLILTGCVTALEAYRSVNWRVIILLAGVIPLGTAMYKTGAATMIADWMVEGLHHFGPRAVMSGMFLLTMVITAVMSNNATAALMVPIAVETANSLEVSPFPFIFSVAYAASLSFATPFGYQTNTLVYGIGQYKFTDFTRIGLPLSLILWVLATVFIPVFWPF